MMRGSHDHHLWTVQRMIVGCTFAAAMSSKESAIHHKALFHDSDFICIAPVPSARSVGGGKDFDLRPELLVGRKVGITTSTAISSDGLSQRHTVSVVSGPIQTDQGVTRGDYDRLVRPSDGRCARGEGVGGPLS